MLHTFKHGHRNMENDEPMDFARPPGGCSAQCGTAGSGWGALALGPWMTEELQMGTTNQQRKRGRPL